MACHFCTSALYAVLHELLSSLSSVFVVSQLARWPVLVLCFLERPCHFLFFSSACRLQISLNATLSHVRSHKAALLPVMIRCAQSTSFCSCCKRCLWYMDYGRAVKAAMHMMQFGYVVSHMKFIPDNVWTSKRYVIVLRHNADCAPTNGGRHSWSPT
jgi:hypothetical protein